MPQEIAQSLMRASLARSGRWASGVAFVGGFISDVLNPLAPFAAYIALGAAVAALILAIAIVLRLTLAERALPAIVFAGTIATMSGALYLVQRQSDAKDGVIAGLVPAVAELQKSLGLVAEQVARIEETVTETQKTVTETQKTVEDVKKTTGDVKADTETIVTAQAEQAAKTDKVVETTTKLATETGKVAETTDKIAETTDKVAEQTEKVVETTTKVVETTTKVAENTEKLAENQAKQAEQTKELVDVTKKSAETTEKVVEATTKVAETTTRMAENTEKLVLAVDRIADGFQMLAAQGGIIADPKQPDEFYHNARFYELSGDMLNARRAYLAFAEFDVDAVDPYIRFATLLRVQDGRAGAREVFGMLADKTRAPAIKLVYALQFEDQPRLLKLNEFIAANPEYAPAFFLLSQEFSEDRLGVQTIADKRQEAEALNTFLASEPDGGLLKYFIDHTLLAEWLERARNRLAALGNVLDPNLATPKIIAQRSNQDWMITITLPEAATGISWRLGADGPFTDTGVLALNDQRTGKPMPNPAFALPASTAAGMLAIKYLDLRGRETGPFELRFDPHAMLEENNKQILDQFWTSWIAFDASGNRGNVYYTHMVSYRCAIGEVRYGFNGGPLDKQLAMPACDRKDPYALPNDFLPFFKVGEDVTSMSVEITYADGSKSPVREFKR